MRPQNYLGNIACTLIVFLLIQNSECKIGYTINNIEDNELDVPEEVQMNKQLDEANHPCLRECKEGEEPMICHYNFDIEWYQTMSKACYDCPYNMDDCFRKDCIPADGISRPLNVINRRLPGPKIEVCHNDVIVVDVKNNLMADATTVHWHGMHQKGTPFMDGTPYVTQCPILPQSTFRYQFNASNAGTHWWHSHTGVQRADGAAGSLVIRKPKSLDPHAKLYDFDSSDHVVIINDWIHSLAIGRFTYEHHYGGLERPATFLINGLGRFQLFNNDTDNPFFMKTTRFNVIPGYRYRFRVINSEFLNCPIEISVRGHNITIIATDGNDLEPITASSLVIYAGERFDFVIHANNVIDNYWFLVRGLLNCDSPLSRAKQVAVLHYEGAPDDEPEGDPSWEESRIDGLQVNGLNRGEEDDETVSVAELKSLHGPDEALKEVPDYQFYLAYDFYAKNNTHFHKSPFYAYNQVKSTQRTVTPQLNHISMKMPPGPFLLSRPSSEDFCNASTINICCKTEFCQCSHVLSVRKDAIVEIVIVDEGFLLDANHPFHLHGHSFRVVGMRRLSNSTTVDQVKAFDEAGLLDRNLKNPPLKDTVTTPDGGYTVVRFKADNPGYWLFHCHIEFHFEMGMALVFKIGEHEEMSPIPDGFPSCGDYVPKNPK